MNLADGELLVGRAWRWDAETIEKDIDIDRRDKISDGESDPPAAISVFAVPHDGGEISKTVERLKTTITQHRRARWLSLVTERELSDQGFTLVLAEPPPDHHDLVLGQVASQGAIVSLENVFNERERVRLQ